MSQLLLAADDTDRFDPRTGLLDQKATTLVSSQAATCYQVAIEFLARKWDGWADKTRASAVETLTIAVTSLIDPDAPPPPVSEEHVRAWLRHIALMSAYYLTPPFDDNRSDLVQRCRHHCDSAAHGWLIRYSLPVSRVDMATAEATLDRFATRLDGAGPTAASSHEQRPLKWRASRATRQVPIPPELVTHLRRHLARYPPTPDSLVFTNQAGRPVHPSAYSRAFGQAKRVALSTSSPLRRSTPYSLRHGNATLLLNSELVVRLAAESPS